MQALVISDIFSTQRPVKFSMPLLHAGYQGRSGFYSIFAMHFRALERDPQNCGSGRSPKRVSP
jgi:hypothetical protein